MGKSAPGKMILSNPFSFLILKDSPNARPQKGFLPNFMQTITPYNDWSSGNVGIVEANGGFMQGCRRKDLIV